MAFEEGKRMYCSSCGVAVAQGLSYCNYCGATLNGVKGDTHLKSSEVKPESLVAAMVAVFVLGLVAITILMGVMKAVLNLDVGQILAFALLSFLIMLSLEVVFVRLLLRGRRGTEEAGDIVLLKGQATKELDAAQARVLPEPVPSVTEHTTRAFDPIYNERSSK
jgi:predicted amidophosphoribosyltransferase